MKRLAKAPIFHALIVFLILFSVFFVFVSPLLAIEIMNRISILASAAVVARFGPAAWEAIRQKEPSPEDKWLTGGILVALSLFLLQTFRLVWTRTDITNQKWIAFLFGALLAVMVFGFLLKALAPPLNERSSFTPYAAIPVALIGGGALLGLIELVEWLL